MEDGQMVCGGSLGLFFEKLWCGVVLAK